MLAARANGLLLAALVAVLPRGAEGQARIEGLASEVAPRLVVFTVRGEGISTPLLTFQERARAAVEAHMNVRVLSLDDLLAKGGSAYQQRLEACRGDAACLAGLVGKVEAKYLLVLTAALLGETRIVGARLIDLSTEVVLGESLDDVPKDKGPLDVVPARIQAAVPPELWDPFGRLAIEVGEPGAQIRVNGRVVGLSPQLTLGYLTPGEYRVEAEKQGFRTASAVARIERDAEARVQLNLVELETSSSSWVLWAGIGAAVVAGAAVGAVVLFSGGEGDPVFCSAVNAQSCR